MRNNRVAWAIGGGIVAFFVIILLMIAIVFHKVQDNRQSKCIQQCAFIQDVRDLNKYSDKSDLEVAEYGEEICYTLENGGATIVYALEEETIIESAIINLCPEVTEQ